MACGRAADAPAAHLSGGKLPAVGSEDVAGLPQAADPSVGDAPTATFAHDQSALVETTCGGGDLREVLAEVLGDIPAPGGVPRSGDGVEGVDDRAGSDLPARSLVTEHRRAGGAATMRRAAQGQDDSG